jgi:hypothetical protein
MTVEIYDYIIEQPAILSRMVDDSKELTKSFVVHLITPLIRQSIICKNCCRYMWKYKRHILSIRMKMFLRKIC